MNKKYSYLISIGIFILFAVIVANRQRTPFNPGLLDGYQNLIFEGFRNTIYASIIALIGSVVLGFIFYLFSASKVRFLHAFTDVFTEIIYGTPLLVMIFAMAYVIGPAFIARPSQFEVRILGVAGIIIYITPYMTNIFKSAFSSISDEQYMAMDLFGFTPFQRYRYIIIPQVIRILMPPLMNNFSLIIKGSALLSVLSYRELFYAVQIVQSRTFAFTEAFLVMWTLYLIITIPLSQLTRWLERRWALE